MALTFKDHYIKEIEGKDAPGTAFCKEIAALTHCSPYTVKQWLSGTQVPNRWVLDILSKYYDQTPEELFPQLNNKAK